MIDLKKEFENGVVITKDNIHLYYKFMSYEDLQYHKFLIDKILATRCLAIRLFTLDNIKFDYNDVLYHHYQKKSKEYFFDNVKYFVIRTTKKFIVRQEFFGIKDTLKPLDEFVSEIKSSEAFLTHLIQNYYDFCEVQEVQEGYYELIDTVSDKLIANGDLSDIMSYINDAHKYVSK